MMPWIERLKSPNVEERLMAFEALFEERSQVINELLQIINQWGETRASDVIEVDSSEHLAFLTLGVLRASEAVPVIIRYIKVQDNAFNPNAMFEKVSLDMHFPALRALVQIGEPSIRYLREAVAMAEDNFTIQLAVVGMIRIEGHELSRFHLETLRKDIICEVIHGNEDNVDKALSLVDIPTVVSKLESPAPTF